MSFASLTRRSSPGARHDVNDDEAGQQEGPQERDAHKEAEERRLDQLELERAADEGMPAPAPDRESDDDDSSSQ